MTRGKIFIVSALMAGIFSVGVYIATAATQTHTNKPKCIRHHDERYCRGQQTVTVTVTGPTQTVTAPSPTTTDTTPITTTVDDGSGGGDASATAGSSSGGVSQTVTVIVQPSSQPTVVKVKVKKVKVRRYCTRQRHGWRCYAKRPPYAPHH